MTADYNGWADTAEDEREALDIIEPQLEIVHVGIPDTFVVYCWTHGLNAELVGQQWDMVHTEALMEDAR